MTKKKFAVGDRVGFAMSEDYENDQYVELRFDEYEDGPSYGRLTGFDDDGNALVEWDANDMLGKIIDPKCLMLEGDLKAKYASLEADFRKVSKEITAKMKEAGKLLLEAQKKGTKNKKTQQSTKN